MLRLIALAGALPALAGFSPRGLDSWRQHSLFILFRSEDPSDSDFVALVSGHLATKLPASRAQPLPVPDLRQIGDLLGSRQYDVALVRITDVAALARGSAPTDPAPLVLLARLRDHLLISRADLPHGHASIIAAALADFPGRTPAGTLPPLPWHPAISE
jgi:hypothetical protein